MSEIKNHYYYYYYLNNKYNKIYMQNNIMSIVDFNFEYSCKYYEKQYV